MTRLHGRSLGGQRCVDHSPGRHWKTYTMLAAIGTRGVLKKASLLLDGPVTGELFLQWTRQRLAPCLRRGDVVIMDNLAAHKVTGVAQAIEAAGASVWYLPAYSPDLNPIEKLWSKVKAWLRRVAARTYDELLAAIGNALDAVPATECVNYFQSCGYDTRGR